MKELIAQLTDDQKPEKVFAYSDNERYFDNGVKSDPDKTIAADEEIDLNKTLSADDWNPPAGNRSPAPSYTPANHRAPAPQREEQKYTSFASKLSGIENIHKTVSVPEASNVPDNKYSADNWRRNDSNAGKSSGVDGNRNISAPKAANAKNNNYTDDSRNNNEGFVTKLSGIENIHKTTAVTESDGIFESVNSSQNNSNKAAPPKKKRSVTALIIILIAALIIAGSGIIIYNAIQPKTITSTEQLTEIFNDSGKVGNTIIITKPHFNYFKSEPDYYGENEKLTAKLYLEGQFACKVVFSDDIKNTIHYSTFGFDTVYKSCKAEVTTDGLLITEVTKK